jgi:hypothetical protein
MHQKRPEGDCAGRNMLCSGSMGRARWTEERERNKERKYTWRKDIDQICCSTQPEGESTHTLGRSSLMIFI